MNKFFALAIGENAFWKNLAEWYQGSLIHELLTYLEERYFTVSLGQYENFSVANSTGTTTRNIIIGLALGIIIASAMMAHTKHGVGRFVRTLIRNGCTDEENAKTLLELGYFQNPSIRRELKRRVTLGKLVRCVEEDRYYNECSSSETQSVDPTIKKHRKKQDDFAIDFQTMHFYVPEELRYRAEIRFEKKGSSWLLFAIVSIAAIIASALLCLLLPDLFYLADNLITLLSP